MTTVDDILGPSKNLLKDDFWQYLGKHRSYLHFSDNSDTRDTTTRDNSR